MNQFRQHASLLSPVPQRVEEETLWDKIIVVLAFGIALGSCALFACLR